MKKVLFVFATLLIICTLTMDGAYAQNLVINTSSIHKNDFVTGSTSTIDNSNKAAKVTINSKALKNFAKSYKNIKNESWYDITDGYIARFFVDSVKNTIYYDTKGRWSGTVKNFSEFQMPVEIRNIVKRTYFDYAITGGVEIETLASDGKPTYVVYIEDKNSIKWLRIFEGEMEVYNEFSK